MGLVDAMFIGFYAGCCMGMCNMMTEHSVCDGGLTFKQFVARAFSCAVLGAVAAFQVWRVLNK